MNLNTNITLAYINYKRLDSDALKKLHSAKITEQISEKSIIKDLGLEVRSIAFIEKCNAVMILIVHDEYYSKDFLTGRILSFWDKYSNAGIVHFIREVQFKYNTDALQFLAEASSGLHSVTVGDSQVMSQIVSGLNSGFFDTKMLHFISGWIRNVIKDVELKTSLFEGNTSVERIASEIILDKLGDKKGAKGIVLGYGQSGKLVAKILNVENAIHLYIANRSQIDITKTELDQQSVVYKRFDELEEVDDIDFCIVALENNQQTQELIQKFIKNINSKSNKILFVDISTPPLLDNTISFIDIEHISKIANKNIENRKQAANKTQRLIVKKLDSVISTINTYIGKEYINEQKNTEFNLDRAKLDLAVKRNKILL